MRHGDNATPGGHRPPEPDGADQWLTRSQRPSLGAAPWERGRNSGADEPPPPRADSAAEDEESSGSHTDGGLTVAELIAKVSGAPESRAARHSAAAEEPPAPAPPPVRPAPPPARPAPRRAEKRPNPLDDPAVSDAPTASIPRVSELPDLERLRRRRPDPVTHILPADVEPLPGDEPPHDEPPHDEAPAEDYPEDLSDEQLLARPRRTRVTARKRHPMAAAGRVAAALAAIVSLVLTGAAWQWTNSKNNSLKNVAALDVDSRDIVDPNAQFGDENFLIVGVDSRAGANSEIGAGDTEDAGGARSDTVMLVNIPANRKRVVVVSFPRDLAITPMECKAWNPDTGEYGPLYDDITGTWGPEDVYTETKLNSAYSYGGPKCLVKVVQKLSGLRVNRFMAIDFVGFSKMVDALGGVEVCSTTALEDYELGTILENPGRQMIDGQTALNYVRARQVTTEFNGDYGRIKRQQMFLSSLLRSLISREVFFHLGRLNDVVNMFINDSYVDNIETKELVQLGQSIQGLAAGRISFVTVPTTGITDENGNEPPRLEDLRSLFSAIINDSPLPGENNENETLTPLTKSTTPTAETSTSTPTSKSSVAEVSETLDTKTTDPAEIRVHVSNSTGQDGLGATAAAALQEHGFSVMEPDDYEESLSKTTVFFAPGNEEAAATVAASFGNAQLERVTGMGDVVQVVLGSDFSAVEAPLPSGSAVRVLVAKTSSSPPTNLPDDLAITNAADKTCE